MEVQKLYRYLDRHQVFGTDCPLGLHPPDLVVVIPCYDEPYLKLTLDSLEIAMGVGLVVEVIVVVNDGEQTPSAIVAQNDLTYGLLTQLEGDAYYSFRIVPLRLSGVRRKHAGVGFARKVGMDLAVWRLARYGQPCVPLVSLDADTRVASNYLQAIHRAFAQDKVQGLTLRFEHDVCGDEFDDSIYQAVAQYELHLRYLYQGLLYSAYPYVCHTVGSAFAVRASVYAKHGGMNRRQGGEDFYFLYKLLPHEHFEVLNSTCVFPSSRPSTRVPFGTGPQVLQSVEFGDLQTYHPDVFDDLKSFVAQVPYLYTQEVQLSAVWKRFFSAADFEYKLQEIRSNASTCSAFVKRFFAYFDPFQVVKFLNFSHQNVYQKVAVSTAAKILLERIGVASEQDLLISYRNIEGR